MAASPIDESVFRQALDKFRSSLTAAEDQDFQLTTADDLRDAIAKLQNKQMSERKMRNFNRLRDFVERMEQFGTVVEVFLNASMFVAYIWGPIKFLLLIASSYTAAFDALLEMYEDMAVNLPMLKQYQTLFQDNPHMRTILHMVYGDILKFHKKALKFFKQKVWRQIFQATWKNLRTKFSRIIENFQSHKLLLESQANLLQFAEFRRSQADAQDRYRSRKEDENRKKRIVIRDWLSAASSADDQEKYKMERFEYPGTGSWILKNNYIRTWCDPTISCTSLLWLTGIPGAGKTILASLLVEELQKTPSTCVLFFYCKHGDQERNSFISIARSLLGQLLRYNKDLLPYFYNSAVESDTKTLTSISVAQSMLSVAFKSRPRIFIVLDGIDECDPDEIKKIIPWFQKEVESINENGSEGIRCLFISQDDQICRRFLKHTPTVKISSDDNAADIKFYCDKLSESWIDTFGILDDERKAVVASVVDHADGMFLFARLVMHNLSNQASRADFSLETSLEIFPRGLDEAYGRIITRILRKDSDADTKYTSKLLGWLVCAKRPLKWHEIQGAIAIDLETQTIDFEKRKLRVDSKHLCGSLVEIRAGGTIELVHTTAKLYLVKQDYVLESKEAYDLCQLCLGYLNHPCINSKLDGDVLKQYVLDGHYAFIDYAIVNWIHHLEDCMRHIKTYDSKSFKRLADEVQRFLDHHSSEEDLDYPVSRETKSKLQPFKNESFYAKLLRTFEYWKNETETAAKRSDDCYLVDLKLALEAIRCTVEDLVLQHRLQAFYGEGIFKCSRLYCKFFYEGFESLKMRIQHDQQHERSFLCMFPTCPASQLGFATKNELAAHITKWHQLSASGDTEFPIYQDPTSIDVWHASATGNVAAVERWTEQFTTQELFDRVVGKRDLWKRYLQDSPLGIAIAKQHYAIVKLLLEKTLDPGKYVYQVIETACLSRKYSILKSVLQIPRVKDTSNEPALERHVSTLLARHEDSLARCLLEYIYSDGSISTQKPISVASRYGCLSTLQYLVENGQDPNIPDPKTRLNALGTAAKYGHIKVVEFLIDHQLCIVDIAFPQVEEALHEAARSGHEDIIRIMFPESPHHTSVQSALKIAQLRNAACHGNAEIVQHLLEDDELPLTRRDADDFTPLLHAVKNGHLSVASLLLNSGRDAGINMTCNFRYLRRNHNGWTALLLATLHGHLAIVKRLLQCEGIDIEVEVYVNWQLGRMHRYRNALQIAKWKNYTEIVDAIQEYKATHPHPTQTEAKSPDPYRIHEVQSPTNVPNDNPWIDSGTPTWDPATPGNNTLEVSPSIGEDQDTAYAATSPSEFTSASTPSPDDIDYTQPLEDGYFNPS
ncbi:hypothetical protein BGW36DRAFT_411385 [Talaromyces proteolyticus]|uniref:NACHT domain-containing protein n=1 Tax=Talaromyces proteolyticus TaxID=1131652 RepID=A0AAD4PS62_9EURO|nr:uncharacterized protein BGW36DRAFT_411385 [Talaromyces proteolyticus]KAH8690547.1 hypothetical protein BGW36DRAFT_411385 [Talaromyces proteolyticus]